MWGLIRFLGLSNLDAFQALLTLLGLLGAAVVFGVGLWQYRTAQKWKVKEFVAAEMNTFFKDPGVKDALYLIDWGSRRLNSENPPEADAHDVTLKSQVEALKPHTMLGEPVPVTLNSVQDCTFSKLEEKVRDTYDCLLDYFERFGSFLESGLVSASDLRPYLQYWIDTIASTDGTEEDLQWTIALLGYIGFYRFTGTVTLFSKFGYDISVKGATWRALVNSVSQPELAEKLQKEIEADRRKRSMVTRGHNTAAQADA